MIQYFLPQKADIETFLHTSVDITLGSANMNQPFVDLDVKLTRHILLIVDHVSPSKHRSIIIRLGRVTLVSQISKEAFKHVSK